MSLLNMVVGALGAQGQGASGNPQAAIIQAIVGMLLQGGGSSQAGGAAAASGLGGLGAVLGSLGAGNGTAAAGAGGLGAILGGLAQMAGGGAGAAGGAGMGGALGGGLGNLLEQFSRAGLGDAARSWVGSGANAPVSAEQLTSVFGADTLGQLARQLGMAPGEVAGQMSQLLPEVVDKLTPQGRLPQGNDLADLANIEGLLGGLLRR